MSRVFVSMLLSPQKETITVKSLKKKGNIMKELTSKASTSLHIEKNRFRQ